MENKYYTPIIEEFNQGFECEWQALVTNKEWTKEVCDIDLINIAHSTFEHEDEDEPFNKQFRVKYLDREDIESFGFGDFKHGPSDWYKLEQRTPDGHASYGYWNCFRLIHLPEGNKIKIMAYEYSFEEKKAILFQGIIKNRSELSKLMQQLGIVL